MPTRAPHFKYRIPAKPAGIRITPDDKQILLEVYRHEIIDAHTIKGMFSRHERSISERLKKMSHSGYLHRLEQMERVHVVGGGSLPITYTLGALGARELRDEFGLKPKREFKRYRTQAKNWTTGHIKHTLDQTAFIVSLRSSAERHKNVDMLYPYEYYKRFAPHILDLNKLPTTVRARVNWHGYKEVEGTIPDGFVVLHYTNLEEKNRRPLFIELDEGEETIAPGEKKQKTLQFWKDTSLLRKWIVYGYAYKTRVHQEQFGIPVFQALTVTTTPGHMKKMQNDCKRFLGAKPHSLSPVRFLFGNFETIRAHKSDLLSVPFEDYNGKPYLLNNTQK